MAVDSDYISAITFFQKYPDQWQALIDGLVAKRNRGFEEAQTALFDPRIQDRTEVSVGIMNRMTAIDDILKEFSGEYYDPEAAAESELPDPE